MLEGGTLYCQLLISKRVGAAPISLRDALAWHVDLLSPISKPALQAFAAFAEGEDGRKLRHLLSPEGHEEYKAWQRQSRSLLEVLEEFDSVRPPLGTQSHPSPGLC